MASTTSASHRAISEGSLRRRAVRSIGHMAEAETIQLWQEARQEEIDAETVYRDLEIGRAQV